MTRQDDSLDDFPRGEVIVFAGRLASMTHEEAIALVCERGGRGAVAPDTETSCLVIGEDGLPVERDGRPTFKLGRVQELQAAGAEIEVLSESTFLERLGLASEVSSRVASNYTLAQIARILEIPRGAVRSWRRAGLIEPLRTVHRLEYFDFRQVASARMLCDFASSGISLGKVKRNLELVRRWLPEIDQPLAQLPLVERAGHLLVRLDDGRFAEPSGQRIFDFLGPDSHTPTILEAQAVPRSPRGSAADFFDLGLSCEDTGKLDAAIVAYERALELGGPEEEISFNLANALVGAGRVRDALELYRRVIAIDADYVEAWNNLGNALVELGDTAAAIEAFERAIEVAPDYADAHSNIGEALARAGETRRARIHWQEYLRLDPSSSWSEKIHGRLRELDRDAR